MNHLLILAIIFNVAIGQDPSCDYLQQLDVTYYVYNKEYPNNYGPSQSCRWQASSPPDTVCRLMCSEVNIPQSNNCTGDRLLISKQGCPQLIGAEKYCGLGSIDVTSVSNKLSVALVTIFGSQGGKFVCELRAQIATPTPTPKPLCKCGWKYKNRIVGGTQTSINEYPMMVGLVDIQLVLLYCGGTIISDEWVLTAAHCIKSLFPANVAVLYGEHNVKINDSPVTGLIRTKKFVTPEKYVNGVEYDIGLVNVVGKIPFGERVGPVCLPFKFASKDFANTTLEALGWGSTSFAGAPSDFLQKVTLNGLSTEACNNIWEKPMVNSSNFCTFTPGKDTCQFDSGGPITYTDPDNGRVYLVAISIGGDACAGKKPGIHTRVASYLDWIKETTKENYCDA